MHLSVFGRSYNEKIKGYKNGKLKLWWRVYDGGNVSQFIVELWSVSIELNEQHMINDCLNLLKTVKTQLNHNVAYIVYILWLRDIAKLSKSSNNEILNYRYQMSIVVGPIVW
jgi:hypothetical protein